MATFADIAPLSEQLRRGFLVTLRPDASPTVHPLTPIYDQGGLYINTYRKSAKVQNLRRRPAVSYVVMTKGDRGAFSAFEARGTARLLETSEVPDSFLAVGTAGEVISQENLDRVRDRLASGKRVYLRVEAEEWTECEPPVPAEAAAAGPDPGGPEPDGSRPPPGWDRSLATGRIAMSAAEVDGFLGRDGIAVLGTVDGQGRPRGRPVRYLARPGRLDLLVPEHSPSLGDLGAEPRACVTAEEFPTYQEIRGVMAHGPAHVTGGPAPPGWVRVRLEPERLVSFDFSKIPNAH